MYDPKIRVDFKEFCDAYQETLYIFKILYEGNVNYGVDDIIRIGVLYLVNQNNIRQTLGLNTIVGVSVLECSLRNG